jgi:hypothetical protein
MNLGYPAGRTKGARQDVAHLTDAERAEEELWSPAKVLVVVCRTGCEVQVKVGSLVTSRCADRHWRRALDRAGWVAVRCVRLRARVRRPSTEAHPDHALGQRLISTTRPLAPPYSLHTVLLKVQSGAGVGAPNTAPRDL